MNRAPELDFEGERSIGLSMRDASRASFYLLGRAKLRRRSDGPFGSER
jgi:hypothetical protein